MPMTRPTPHPKTGVYRLRKAVPPSLQGVVGKRELIVSLRTKDPSVARKLAPEALRKIEAQLDAARAASLPGCALTFREIAALCGVWYRREVAEFEDDPGDPAGWEAADDALLDKLPTDKETGEPLDFQPGADDLAEARGFLAEQGVAADADSLRRFAVELFHSKRKAAGTLRRRAEGDYSPDPALAAFPSEPVRREAKPAGPLPLTAEALLEAWAAERRPSAATRKKYRIAFGHVARILGFDDLRRVTTDDVVRFKSARLAEGRDPGTVADDVLAAGTVCKWAVENRMLPGNPFAGLAPKVNRRGPARRTPYGDDEAARILTAARGETGWLRWLPWLICFTGARISEVAEMRRRDVRRDSGVDILDFLPLANRAGKNGTFQRMVPLHPAVIAEGFLDYVRALPADPDGPLFPDLAVARDGTRTTTATTQHGRWVKGKVGIAGQGKAPAHSWRHRMEDELRKVRALPEVQDAITGRHNPRNAGDGYGRGFRGMPDEVLKELAKVPSPVPPLRSREAA